ncbi:hypothetical protein MTP99_002741 [Tenebrio molitor]|nr:hypothetical protein MTP99_002741 [Tenebrio molitor]
MGFKWKKSSDNRQVLLESHDIRLKRIEYVKKITQLRNEHQNIVFTDETCIHSSHTQNKDRVDDRNCSLKGPISKGNGLIIVHAGDEMGFVNDALLIFKSGSKSGDYYVDMNITTFERWLRTKLIPNLPPNSVLVLDNASYHNIVDHKEPTNASKKCQMIEFLCRNVVNVEKNFIEKEHLFDDAMDHLQFAVNTDSSDEEWDSEDNVDMSGVVPLDSDSE